MAKKPKFDKGDTLALEAMNQELAALREEQERARIDKIAEEQEFQNEAIQTFQDGGKLTKKQKTTLGALLNNNRGPDQPGIPQGGPSGLAGGRQAGPPQIAGQSRFQRGGRLNRRQQEAFGTLSANRNIPFVNRMLEGQPVNLEAGVNPLGQPSVFPQRFPGSEQPIIPRGGQNLGGVGVAGQNQISFQNPREARQFARRAPRAVGNILSQGQATQPVFRGGGKLPTYQGINLYPNQLNFNTGQGYLDVDPLATPLNYFDPQTGGYARIPTAQQQPGGGVAYGDRNVLAAGRDFNALAAANTSPANLQANVPTSLGGYQAALANQNINQDFPTQGADIATGQDELDLYKFRAPAFGALATAAGSFFGNRQLRDIPTLEGVEDVAAEEFVPRTVSYARSREQIQRERDRAQAEIRRAAKGRGTQQGLTQSTIAGATATQGVAGQQFSASQEAEANKNVEIQNRAAMFNAQQRAMAGQTNLRTALMRGQFERENALINAQRRQNQIAGVTGAITGYGRDLLAANYATGSLRLGEDPEFPIQQRNDALWKRLLGVDADPYKVYTGPERSLV